MHTQINEQKSEKILRQSEEAYRSLDIPGAYRLALDAIESNPANIEAYSSLKYLMSSVAFSYPEIFDGGRMLELINRSLEMDMEEPTVWDRKGWLHKIENDLEAAEEAYFRAVFHGNNRSHWFSQMYNIFELGYVYKNMGDLETFNSIAFSIPWNVNMHRRTGRMAIPGKVFEKRLITIDFSIPPIKYVRKLKKDPGKLHLLSTGDSLPDRETFKRFLSVFERNKINFKFFHIPSTTLLLGKDELERNLMESIPANPSKCPVAMMTDGFCLRICPVLAEQVRPVLNQVEEPWEIIEEKHPWCECR